MYTIAITPLTHLENNSVKQAWYADDATAGGNINDLKTWWDDIEKTGSDYGYHPNASKTWLIVKENHLEAAKAAFQGTEVQITTEGKRHLGAAIGTPSFVESYVQKKASGWIEEVKHLSSIAVTQPHAAYAAFTHGLASRWTYLSRTIPNIEDNYDETTRDYHPTTFPASLTGQNPFNDQYRDTISAFVPLNYNIILNFRLALLPSALVANIKCSGNFFKCSFLTTYSIKLIVLFSQNRNIVPPVSEVEGTVMPAGEVGKCLGYWWKGDLFATKSVDENIKKARRSFSTCTISEGQVEVWFWSICTN